MPVQGALKHFRDEFEYHVQHKKCLVNRRRAEIAGVSA
jgi:NADH-quinone oxidoreductase subunit F